MIRVGLPSPLLLRMRLRVHLALTRISRAVQAVPARAIGASGVLRGTTHAVVQDTARVRAVDSVVLEQALTEFERRYDRLVDLLCFSAQGIVYGDADGRLSDIRAWFRENYDVVRPVLSAQLYHGCGVSTDRAQPDDFERLFLAEDVTGLIHSDTLIPAVQRTRAALEACLDTHCQRPVA
jgi:hypothetical protein